MDGSGPLALDDHRQARVDGILDRPSSLTKNGVATPLRHHGAVLGPAK
jgi:hypothetical protein